MSDNSLALALWYFWQRPDLEQHAFTLDRCADPIVLEVKTAIEAFHQGDNSQLVQYTAGKSAQSELLDFVWANAPDDKTIALHERLQKRRRERESLASELFGQEAVMVAPTTRFSGVYPQNEGHTCKTGARVSETSKGVSITQLTADLWRMRLIGGMIVNRCEGCYQKRVWRLCKQIEDQTLSYPIDGDMPLYISEIENPHTLAGRVRTWRKRHGLDIAYAVYPTRQGTFVIHDCPEKLGGDMMPTTREKLYQLMNFLADTPDGHRINTSNGWGRSYAGIRGDGRKKGYSEPEEAPQEPETTQERIKIAVKDVSRLKWAIYTAYGVEIRKRDKVDTLTIEDVILCLEATQTEYGIIEGHERVNKLVTGYAHRENLIKNPCDQPVTPPPKLSQKPAKSQQLNLFGGENVS